MGESMAETGSDRAERVARRLGLPVGPFMVQMFSDPSPDSIVNLRVALPLVGLIPSLELDGRSKEVLMDIVVLVCKKLVAAWRHLDAYEHTEAILIDRERSRDLSTPAEGQ